MIGEGFDETEAVRKIVFGAVAPVIGIARDDQWRLPGNMFLDQRDQAVDLAAPLLFGKRQVYAYGMNRRSAARQRQLAMQQAPAFQPMHRHVVIGGIEDGQARQDGVAMMAVIVGGVTAVGCGPACLRKGNSCCGSRGQSASRTRACPR